MIRELLLQGHLYLPGRDKFVKAIGDKYTRLAEQMFNSLWRIYLTNKGSTSLPYWSQKFNNPEVFNIVLMSLSKAGWIVTIAIPARNWGECKLNENKLLQYVSSEELEYIRAHKKVLKYVASVEESTIANKTRQNGSTKDTGLVREGFMLAGNTRYQYDTAMLDNYSYIIERNLTKAMDKIKAKYDSFKSNIATYDTISIDILNYHISNPEHTMTRGNNYNDSRGRAISSGLTKVFNPISNKDARACLVIPE